VALAAFVSRSLPARRFRFISHTKRGRLSDHRSGRRRRGGGGAAPKGKLKLIIASGAVVGILGLGTATWYMFLSRPRRGSARGGGAAVKPSIFIEVRKCWSTGRRARRARAVFQAKIVIEVKEEKQARRSSRQCRRSPMCFKPICASCAPPISTGPRACFA